MRNILFLSAFLVFFTNQIVWSQSPMPIGVPETTNVTTTTAGPTLVAPAVGVGKIPMAVTLQNIGTAGNAYVLNDSSGLGKGGYFLQPGQSVTIDGEMRCYSAWFVMRASSTNVTIQLVRQYKQQ